jgi:hypothetical protein
MHGDGSWLTTRKAALPEIPVARARRKMLVSLLNTNCKSGAVEMAGSDCGVRTGLKRAASQFAGLQRKRITLERLFRTEALPRRERTGRRPFLRR